MFSFETSFWPNRRKPQDDPQECSQDGATRRGSRSGEGESRKRQVNKMEVVGVQGERGKKIRSNSESQIQETSSEGESGRGSVINGMCEALMALRPIVSIETHMQHTHTHQYTHTHVLAVKGKQKSRITQDIKNMCCVLLVWVLVLVYTKCAWVCVPVSVSVWQHQQRLMRCYCCFTEGCCHRCCNTHQGKKMRVCWD